MPWPCAWYERNGKAAIKLRRYSNIESAQDAPPVCPTSPYLRYHNATKTRARTRKLLVDGDGYIRLVPEDVKPPKAEYPKTCDYCDYAFTPTDEWQCSQEPIYVRPDTGETFEQRKLPIGAMYDGYWSVFGKGEDGISLFVVLPKPDPKNPGAWIPDYWWDVDGPATNYEGGHKPNAWTRTGDPRAVPPTVSATPSILTPHYHGYLSLIDGATHLIDPI